VARDQADLVAQPGVARARGFEVIAPDLRGFGDSDLTPDGFYDLAAHARDCYALVHDAPMSWTKGGEIPRRSVQAEQ
jgi:pimeloyl-ACP methyl ester carboxylesterase